MISMHSSLFAEFENFGGPRERYDVRSCVLRKSPTKRKSRNINSHVKCVVPKKRSHSKVVTRVRRQNRGIRCNANEKAERQGGRGLPCCKEIALAAKNLATDIGSPQSRADDRAYSQGLPHCNTGNCVVVSLSVMCSWQRPAHITSQPYKRGRPKQQVGVLTCLKTGRTINTPKIIESAAESINALEQVRSNRVARQIQSTHTLQ